ncbi:MAG: DUF1801 domain-containing protein [Candidatus Omnitrophica bacterium]|nr:DUF1801 domain-containing protein [Candidatus Omnitrophota bacterium]
MKINTNDRIERFMRDTLFVDEQKGEILVSLRNAILKISPDAQEEIKYGGLVFNVDTKLICGIFIRKKHLSLEFSFGMKMSDPDKCLEGDGKYRRHLKIFDKKDIKSKKVKFYVKQAFSLKC